MAGHFHPTADMANVAQSGDLPDVQSTCTLTLRSQMPDNGVIFSDEVESDFIRLDAGPEVDISVSEQQSTLVE